MYERAKKWHVCRPLLVWQEELQRLLPEGFVREQDVFMLSLKRYMYSCPVCWERTLPYRGDCIICPECGWEDDGTDRIDAPTLTNGDYTIRSYRKMYLHYKKVSGTAGTLDPADSVKSLVFAAGMPDESESNDDQDAGFTD